MTFDEGLASPELFSTSTKVGSDSGSDSPHVEALAINVNKQDDEAQLLPPPQLFDNLDLSQSGY